jgi:RNA polymerase sigma factor (sigma-70 family)
MKNVSAARRERFEALFERNHAYVTAYAMRRAPGGLVDDVVGETFLIAWCSLDRVPEDPLPWLYGVARRVLANHRRARRRRAALSERLSRERDATLPVTELDVGVSERVRDALLALSAREREAALLIAWEGLTPAQAAIAAGCTDAAFRVRLHRARRHLTRALAATAAAGSCGPFEPAKETR